MWNSYDMDVFNSDENTSASYTLNFTWERTYLYYVTCNDSNQNSNVTETRSITFLGTVPNINFISPTPANGTATTNTLAVINVSITNAADLNTMKFNWNGTNYTMYNDSLILMMNFDNVSALGENGTYAVDASKRGNNGILYNGATWNATGRYGGAMRFDGVNDYVSVPHSSSLD
jgi:hypothetical protein